MSTVICIQSELSGLLANQPPYDRLDVTARRSLGDTFFRRDYVPGDVLAQKGRPVDYVGFVQSGVFDIYSDDAFGVRHCLGSLGAKDFFGELSTMLNGNAIGCLACRTQGRCYLQSRSVFHATLARYETLHTFFLQSALTKLWTIYQQVQPEALTHSETAAAPYEVPRIIEKALSYIEKHFKQSLSLEEMSNGVGLSRYHLSRTFKQYLGKSFKEYLTERRITEAKHLMAHDDKNVTEACFAVGFNDTSYFARVFRKREGISPSAYRKRLVTRRRYPPLLRL